MTSTPPLALPPLAGAAGQVTRPANATSEARQRQVALEFEGQVLGALLQPMFEGVRDGGSFGGGAGESQWQPMLVNEFGKALARAGGVGLADEVIGALRRIQDEGTTP
jgi:Rod binding domain-containing protein